jgi:hypothetical protein
LFTVALASPYDVEVVNTSAREIEVSWTHYPICYAEYHVTVTRTSDKKIVFTGDAK